MPQGSSPKRERQYEHIKESYKDRGRSTDKAEELAARTVNKQRAQAGETKARRAPESRDWRRRYDSCRSLASGQAVRRLTLDQEIEGSNPSSPANPRTEARTMAGSP